MDLVTLTMNGNPIYDLPHAQSFIINVLPSLDDLDEEVVDPQMRENAKKRSGTATVTSCQEIDDVTAIFSAQVEYGCLLNEG